MDEQRLQLLKRVQYLERSILLNRESTLNDNHLSLIINKLKSLIDSGHLQSFLGVDAVFHYLVDKIQNGDSDIDRVAEEMRNFVN